MSAADRTMRLPVEDVRLLHLAASTTIQVYDAAEQGDGVPAHAPLYGKRHRLLELARLMDHVAHCPPAQPSSNEEKLREALASELFCDLVLDELVVIAGGQRGMTDSRVNFARWDMKAALAKALERFENRFITQPEERP